jgi:hypothetical protein
MQKNTVLKKKDEFIDFNSNKINIDFISDFQLSNDFFIFEKEEDIINSIKKAINNLEEVYLNFKEIKIKKLEEIEKDKEKILKSEIKKNKVNLYTIKKNK